MSVQAILNQYLGSDNTADTPAGTQGLRETLGLKARVFDYLRQPVTAGELALEVSTLEHKSEVYVAACMVSGIDHSAGRTYLQELGEALQLPRGLTRQLDAQVQEAATGK